MRSPGAVGTARRYRMIPMRPLETWSDPECSVNWIGDRGFGQVVWTGRIAQGTTPTVSVARYAGAVAARFARVIQTPVGW